MKRILAAALAVVTLVVAPTALAAGPTLASLARDVKALKADLKKAQATIKKLEAANSEQDIGIAASLVFTACSASITSDLFQGTWNVVDQVALATPLARAFFGAQTPVVDPINSCSLLNVARVQIVPPTISPFSSLFSLLRP